MRSLIAKIRKQRHNTLATMFRIRLFGSRGFTLTEVLAAIVLSTILIGMAAVAIFTFYTKYKELSMFSQLQQDAFNAVETIKYGYPFDIAYDYVFLGVANSRSITLETTGAQHGQHSGIYCYSEQDEEGGANNYVRYYFDREQKAIRVQSLQGVRFYQDRIFPSRNDSNIEVTSLQFASLTGDETVRVVSMELKARIIISEDKIRYVTYKTNIALGR